MWYIIYLLAAIVAAILYKDNNYQWIYIIAKTYRRDIILIIAYVRLQCYLVWWTWRHATVPSVFTSIAKKHPQKIAFYFEDDIWTFSNVEDYSNQIARYFKNQGYKKGDCVALILENSCEYSCFWLGLAKIGVITALINTNLVSTSLLHSINSANCKAIIFGSKFNKTISNISSETSSLKLYAFHEDAKDKSETLSNSANLRKELEDVSEDPLYLDLEYRTGERDAFLYIYTSGTTGLPKAASISHIRYMMIALVMNLFTRCSINDVIYTPLPLYHSAGVILGVGQTMIGGVTVAIRKKFSASNYWKDCQKYKCTRAQYIGEMCRYLLATPNNEPKKHYVKSVYGNGLKPQIWNKFTEKFKIKQVFEFYGSTEGNSNFINVDNTVGCVGAIPRYAEFVYPIRLIKCNEATGEPIRNEKGFFTKCKVNEPGLLIGYINQQRVQFAFKGYSDKKASAKKVLQNVFKTGDLYFNSGDILVRDELGNMFFKDRTGDTYRWKGENVSTAEVEGVISNVAQLSDAAVFGVEIPGTEGKAGMAAIVDLEKTLNLDTLGSGLISNLPSYAVPMFIRILESIPLTGTYKMKKTDLQADGYDVNKVKDKLYFYDSKLKKYIELTNDLYEQIQSGKLKF